MKEAEDRNKIHLKLTKRVWTDKTRLVKINCNNKNYPRVKWICSQLKTPHFCKNQISFLPYLQNRNSSKHKICFLLLKNKIYKVFRRRSPDNLWSGLWIVHHFKQCNLQTWCPNYRIIKACFNSHKQSFLKDINNSNRCKSSRHFSFQ